MAQTAPGPGTDQFLLQPSQGVSRLAEDIFCLSCPVPFDVGSVNTYLLTGDPITLIDTGSRIGFTVDDLATLVERAGFVLEDVRQLVLTHRHIDHFGIARQVRERTGATVVSSHVDGPFMAAWEDNASRSRGELKRWGKAFDIPDELFDLNEKQWRRITAMAESVQSDRLVGEGDVLEAGGRTLRVIEAPGHTEGLITFFDERNGVYFANDHVLRHITPNPDVYDYDPASLRSGLPDYVAALRRVRELPVSLVLPGHGHEMTDLAGRVDEVLEHHDRRATRVLGLLAETPRSVFEVVGLVWDNLRPQDSHLAVREIIGHLVLLEQEGRATHDTVDGVLRYRPV